LFIVIVHGSFSFLKQGIIHFAFGGCDHQFELLINAVIDVLAGIVIKNVVTDVLSEPKSNTATDLLPWVEL
jgi:phage-related holin